MESHLTLIFLLVSLHLIQGTQTPPCTQQHQKHSTCNHRSYRSKNRRSMDFASSGDSMEDDEDLHDSKTIVHTPGRTFINTIYHSRTRSMLANSLPASLQAHTETFQPTHRVTAEVEGSGENTKETRNLPMAFQWPIQGARRYNHTYPDSTTEDPSIPENPMGLEDPTLLLQEWEEEPTVRISKATFRGSNGSQVNAQAGTTAHIPCTIINRADHETVSWIRLRDHHLITVGRQTYSSDERFSVTFNRHKQEWTLHLRYAQHRDAGEYVCQLSTHPPMVFITTLTITQAEAEISGGPDRYVQEGSVVKLTCKLRLHSQAPEYVFWYHNRTMINFDTNRQVTVEKTSDGSILTLKSVVRADSGNYTCLPAKARPASLILHIIQGDAPAAMQVSSTSSLHQRNECILSLSNFTRFPLLGVRGPFLHIPLLLILQVIAT